MKEQMWRESFSSSAPPKITVNDSELVHRTKQLNEP